MTLSLSDRAAIEAQKLAISPQIVLEIDGVSTLFGAVRIKRLIRYGEGLVYGGGHAYGDLGEVADQADYISFDRGTTTSINQQLRPDEGTTSSISSMTVSLIDKNNEITELITPGIVVDDIMAKKAVVYFGFANTAFPEDYVVLFRGIIDDVVSGPGLVELNIAHPDTKKRQKIFQRIETELSSALHYKSATIQDLTYAQGNEVGGTVRVRYTTGATAGAEVVSVSGQDITVQIENAVSTAAQIKTAVESSAPASALVAVVITGEGSTAQTSVGFTSMANATTIPVVSTTNFLAPVNGPDGSNDESLTFYVRIGDEIIKYETTTSTTFGTITRGQFGTRPAFHESGETVTSFYVLEGNVVDLALKLMLSGQNGYYKTSVAVTHFQQVGDASVVSNAIFFQGVNVEDKYGLTVGDYVTTVSATNGANNVSLKPITEIYTDDAGSHIVVDDVTFVTETDSAATISFRSQYDTLGEGLAMTPDEVDVEEHQRLGDLFLSALEYRFYLKDTIDGKEFIEKEIYAPYGAYAIPRKGRASLGYHSGPIPTEEVKVFNKDLVKKPNQIKLRRSTSRHFFNTIVYKFDEDPLDDKFLAGTITVDQDSKNRIVLGTKAKTIVSRGIRSDLSGVSQTSQTARRMLSRYKYAAEHFESVSVFFREGFNAEIGDVHIFDPTDLMISNTTDGSREKPAKFYEIMNKKVDIKTGEVMFTLVDTNFSLDERYGLVAPSSVVGTGSTTSSIVITDSFGSFYPGNEKKKWEPFIGLPINVHSEDYSYQEETTLTGFDPTDRYKMQVSPPLSGAPSAGYVIDLPKYPTSTDPNENRLHKLIHAFMSPRVTVVSGVSATQFTVGAGDAAKFFVGGIVEVHNTSFSVVSAETKVSDVTGTTITVEDDLGFTPAAGYEVDFIGFADQEQAYRVI